MDDPLADVEDDELIIAIKAQPDTWLPEFMVGFLHDGEFVSISMEPLEALSLGLAIMQQAKMVNDLREDLESKTLEEREEVVKLYSQFLLPSADAQD